MNWTLDGLFQMIELTESAKDCWSGIKGHYRRYGTGSTSLNCFFAVANYCVQ